MSEPSGRRSVGAGPGPGGPDEPDARVRAQLRAARERGRFEHELDETRALLDRRTAALERTQRNLTRLLAEHDRLRSDPVVRAWLPIRSAAARLKRAPARLLRIVSGPGRQGGRGTPALPERPIAPMIAAASEEEPLSADAFRVRLQGRLLGGAEPLRLVVLGTPGEPLEAAIRANGWELAAPERAMRPDVALVVDPATDAATIPRDVIRVGWIRANTQDWLATPWLDDLDLVVVGPAADRAAVDAVVGATSSLDGPSGLSATLARHLASPRLVIQIGPATWKDAAHWGDTSFARALERAFRRRGWATSVLVEAEGDGAIARRADTALHVVGLRRPPLHPGQTHLLWIISHPDEVRPERCDAYDAVFVASDTFADQLRLRVRVPVMPLHQATDPRRFFPEPGGPAHDLLFVGNSRNRRRPVLDALAASSRDLAVYGTNWRPELLDPSRLRGEWIPNESLHRYYAAAAIVLNDHWPDMRDEGFISNRIYDALASGAFVLSDNVPGMATEFDGGLATWHDADSLRAAIDRYLPDTAARTALAERGRQAVLARHTFDHRAATILETTGLPTTAA